MEVLDLIRVSLVDTLNQNASFQFFKPPEVVNNRLGLKAGQQGQQSHNMHSCEATAEDGPKVILRRSRNHAGVNDNSE